MMELWDGNNVYKNSASVSQGAVLFISQAAFLKV